MLLSRRPRFMKEGALFNPGDREVRRWTLPPGWSRVDDDDDDAGGGGGGGGWKKNRNPLTPLDLDRPGGSPS